MKWLVVVGCVLVVALWLCCAAGAEEYSVWVLCQPDSFVYVREFPKRGADCAGYGYLGDRLTTDGRTKNGYLHIIGFECGGWIHKGFVTDCPVIVREYDAEIVSKGRVACRRYIGGTRRRWLKKGETVTVYASADDWSITSQGFVMSQFLREIQEQEGGT